MTYNGYRNYETWAVMLWLSNDQGTDTRCTELAVTLDSPMKTGDAIKEFIEERAITITENDGMLRDILMAALGEVDWTHIGENYDEAAEYYRENDRNSS